MCGQEIEYLHRGPCIRSLNEDGDADVMAGRYVGADGGPDAKG